MHIIGQEKILNKIDSYSLSTLPHNICLFGQDGSGRHTLVKYMSEKFCVPVVTVAKDVDYEDIVEYQRCVNDKIYLVNLNELNEKAQNKLLKFVEKPSAHVFVVMIARSEIGVIDTILNRCMKFKLENYTKEELRQVRRFEDDRLYEVCKTPGQLSIVDTKSFNELISVCEAIVTKINRASYSNTISIAQKINYKEEYDKFDFNLFLNTLEYVAFKTFKETNSEISYKVYNIVNRYKSKILTINNSPIKENYIINLLTNLWNEVAQ